MSTFEYNNNEFTKLLKNSISRGHQLDLTECCYGPPTGKGNIFNPNPMPYYYFLAGLAYSTNATKIIEIGTHFGGASLSFLKGMETNTGINNKSEIQIVTIDTNRMAKTILKDQNKIELIIGEAQQTETILKAISLFEISNIDILFIDALKSAEFVTEVIRQLQIQNIEPKYLIFDDISSNKSMRDLWKVIYRKLGKRATLISNINSDLRDKNNDMAIIDMTQFSKEIMEEIGNLYTPRNTQQKHGNDTMNEIKTPESQLFKPINIVKNVNIRKSDAAAIYTLIKQYFRGKGKIVTIKDESYEIIKLAINALDNSGYSNIKKRVIHSLSPTYDPYNETELSEKILSSINITEINADQLRWTGENIEIAILGSLQTQKQFSNTLSEILEYCIPKTSYIIVRDAFIHYRLWIIATLSILSEFIELKATDGRSLIIKLNKTIPHFQMKYVSTYNFSAEEIDYNMENLSRKYEGRKLQIDILLQLAWFRVHTSRLSLAKNTCIKISKIIGQKPMTLRKRKLEDIQAKILKLSQ